MNRYPVWKYAIIVIALLVGVLYTLPNFFGEAPAVPRLFWSRLSVATVIRWAMPCAVFCSPPWWVTQRRK